LRARGGLKVDMEWANGKLINAVLASELGGKVTVRHRSRTVELTLARGQPVSLGANLSRKS
jgi:alpha-L-fucosidase 2